MMTKDLLDKLRLDLSIKAKNGLDFTLAAAIIWALISFIWTVNTSPYNKSIFTFMVGALLLPLAFLFSKLFKTTWTIEDNPLQPLGLWLNFSQLFYFPFLVFTMIKMPGHFIMVYAIITGGHFFPYAWFYKTRWYAIFAGIIVLGALFFGLSLPNDKTYFVGIFTSISLLLITICLYFDSERKLKNNN
ncbi:MAG: hypothetical protein JWP69_1763 [Flaviaesturariibacter sp.]|nr:hypothetical protein [Flaviaesturariibacter sp.]